MQLVFSPNMLKTFEQCQKKYAFRYIKNISMPVNDDIFESGKNIHALASYYLRKENIDKLENSLSVSEKILWNNLKTSKYFSYEVVNTEYNLSVKINGKFFGGRLDALVKDNGKFYILDYKTGKAPKNAKYDYQTIVYILAVREFFNTDNIAFVYLDLKNNEEVQIELSSDLVKEYEQKLADIVSKIDLQDYKSNSNLCSECEYKPVCF